MGADTKIEWARHTFNPWLGCTKVSRACQHCYAEAWAKRSGLVGWGPKAPRRRTSAAKWKEPLKWNAEAEKAGDRPRVFCASLADVFDDHESILPEWRRDLWDLIAATPNLQWLLLTKRPEHWPLYLPVAEPRPPFMNIRLGVTIEDQDAFDARGPKLQFAADVGWPTFVSYEPASGSVDWAPAFAGEAIGWMISGGESGHDASPSHPDWHRTARDLCQRFGVPYLFKQWGSCLPGTMEGEDERGRPAYEIDEEHSSIDYDVLGKGRLVNAHRYSFIKFPHKNTGRLLDGRTWDEVPG